MVFPKLFKFHSENMVETVENLETETTLGIINVLIKFSQSNFFSKNSIKKVLKYKKSSVFILEEGGLYVEVVKLPIAPKIPKHMQVEKCIAYLIRFKCLKKLQPQFICALDFADGILEGDPESGEGMISQSFEHENTRLTIGTEDEDYLEDRAKNQRWMPYRLFTDELISYENVGCIEDGVKIVLPPFLEEEVGQIQFVISWTQVKANDSISTWFAVDVSPEEILRQSCP